MKLSLLVAALSFAAAGTAVASNVQTQTIPQPVVNILHDAFLGANNLGMADSIVYGAQYETPVPADVQAIAQKLKGACAVTQSQNNVQTINGSTCPIADTTSYTVSGDQTTVAYQDADTTQISDANLRNQLQIVSTSVTDKGTQSQTSTTFASNDTNHTEVATVSNHKIVLDYTMAQNGIVTNESNGEANFTVQHINVAGTLLFDGQKHTGTLVYDAGTYNQNYTCTIDGAPLDCQTFTYIFGFVAPSLSHR